MTIAIIEDHPIVVEGLQKILSNNETIYEIKEYHLGEKFVADLKAKAFRFDLAFLDITLPDCNGIDLCRDIKKISPDTIVLGFSNHSDRSIVLQLLSNGASGYLLKNAAASEIRQCLDEALAGKITFSKQIAEIMAKPSSGDMRVIQSLTKREKQVLKMVSDGKTSVEISKELQVSPLTIETHRRNLLQKLDVKNVAEMIKAATDMKLL